MGGCPFNDGDPRLQVDPDQPCPVCGDYGDGRAVLQESRCVGGSDRVDLAAEVARLRGRVRELEADLASLQKGGA